MNSLLQTLEEIDELLQDLSETPESRTPAAPEPQLYIPLNAHGEDSQYEPIQNQATTPSTPTMISACSNIPETVLVQNSSTNPVKALDVPPGDLSETFSMNQRVTSFGQRTPTATSWMTYVADNPNTSFTDCQKITSTANTTIPNEDSQMKPLSDDLTLCGGQMTFIGDQTHYGGLTTFSAHQSVYGGQMTFSGDQRATHSGDQTLYGAQMMTLKGDHMTTFTDHTCYGSHMMPCKSSSLPYPEFPYFSSSRLTQGQSLENQKSKLKSQRCRFQKNLDVLKPYTCTYQDCGKSYSKRSHLQIHERRHTGE